MGARLTFTAWQRLTLTWRLDEPTTPAPVWINTSLYRNFVHAQSIDTPDLSSKLDSYLQPYVRTGDFSGVVLVAQGDRILSVREYGSGST